MATRVAGRPSTLERHLPDPVHALLLDLLQWLAPGPRPYADVIEAWRTSCPRLPVWEEASDRAHLELRVGNDGVLKVHLTASGRDFLCRHRAAAS